MKRALISLFAALAMVVITPLACLATADDLQPFVLASNSTGSVTARVGEVKHALVGAGFEVVGDYAPYPGGHVLVATSAELKENATQSAQGGFGAVVRIGITEVEGKVQVSYTNPTYWANAYRMQGDLASVSAALAEALGRVGDFGYAKGFSGEDLRKYHYLLTMPYFDDQEKVGSFDSTDAAVNAVEANLKAGKGGAAMVYRVDLPDGKGSVFGVAIKQGAGADAAVMAALDTGKLRHTAHLPYEVLIEGGKVYALRGRFRIAISFPEHRMETFMKIDDAPDAIIKSLKAAAE